MATLGSPAVIPVRREEVNLVFLAPCPFCGLKHRHGAAGGDGPRAAHCPPGTPGAPSGYILQNDLRVISCPNPFRVEREILHMRPGQTVAGLLAEIEPNPVRRRQANITVNGEIIRPEMWATTIPRPGSLVVIRIFPSNRGIAMIFVAIAAMAATIFLGPAGAPLWGIEGGIMGGWAGLAGLAVGVVGGLMVNALIPPARPATPSLGSQQKDNPTQFISGARNQLIPFGTIPSLLGFMRVVPLKLAMDYTEVEGSDQYVRCLFGQYGPLEISDLKIGTTAIGNFEGVELAFRNCTYVDPDGRSTTYGDEPFTLYTQDIHEDPEQILLEYNIEQIRTSQTQARELSFDITFPSGLYSMNHSSGARESYSCDFQPRYRLTDAGGGVPGGWVYLPLFTVTASTSSAVRKGFRWVLPAEGEYDVGLTRLTGGDDTYHVSVSYWTAFRTIKYNPPITFPGILATIEVRIKASNQLNGTLDEFNFFGRSIFPDWDAETETWIPRPTNNPASLFRAVAQGPAAPIPYADEDIDLNKLAYWHEYCVTNGLADG